mgnify:CR=1 FL=1
MEATEKLYLLPSVLHRHSDETVLFNHINNKKDYDQIKCFCSCKRNKPRKKRLKQQKNLTACSLKEEGCIAYDTFESSTRRDVFMICETWQNAEVLAAHEKSAHFAQYVGIIQELAEMKLEKFEF